MTLFKDSTNLQMPFFQYPSQNVSSVLDNDTKPMHYVQMFWMERTQTTCTFVIFPAFYNGFGFCASKALDAVQRTISYQRLQSSQLLLM